MAEIYVFASNERGIHGAGSAVYARDYKGAKYGQAEGLSGESYAIPTKNKWLKRLPLEAIKVNVDRFLEFARSRPDLCFYVTSIGCGLAYYTPADIAPMFADHPPNVRLNDAFQIALAVGPEADLLSLL